MKLGMFTSMPFLDQPPGRADRRDPRPYGNRVYEPAGVWEPVPHLSYHSLRHDYHIPRRFPADETVYTPLRKLIHKNFGFRIKEFNFAWIKKLTLL